MFKPKTIYLIVLSALLVLLPKMVSAAALYFSPPRGNYQTGGQFSVSVKVNTEGIAINAVDGVVAFNKDTLEIVSISKRSTIISLWVQEPSFSNTAGTVTLGGIALNPGYTGSGGTVLTLNLRAKKEGTGQLSFSSASVLANDGLGTNVLKSSGGGSYVISGRKVTPPPGTPKPGAVSEPVISSSTHPDYNKWYQNNNPNFNWQIPQGLTEIRFGLDREQDGTPGTSLPATAAEKAFSGLGDGTWYFHLQYISASGSGPVGTFRVQIDSKPPAGFKIEQVFSGTEGIVQPEIVFETTDETSGIDFYEVKIQNGDWQKVAKEFAGKPHGLPINEPGEYEVHVKAVDKAGNETESSIIVRTGTAQKLGIIKAITSNVYVLLVVCLVILIVLLYILRKYIPGIRGVFTRVSGGIKTYEYTSAGSIATRPEIRNLLRDVEEELNFFSSIERQRELNPDERRIKSKFEDIKSKIGSL